MFLSNLFYQIRLESLLNAAHIVYILTSNHAIYYSEYCPHLIESFERNNLFFSVSVTLKTSHI